MAKRSGGLGGFISSVVSLIIVGGLVVAWLQYTGIDSVGGALDWFKSRSDKASYCTKYAAEHGGKLPPDCANFDPKAPGPDGSTPSLPDTDVDVNEWASKLEGVSVGEPENVNYARSEWKHWTGTPCNTRKRVLISQGTNVKYSDDSKCKITAGTWVSPYEGLEITDQRQIDIDHVVPLGYAAIHGGNSWDSAKKEQFANDESQLLAVSAKENRSKGASGPAEYMPPDRSYHCEYARKWIGTTSKYGLTVSEADKKALEKGLATCR